MESPLLNDFDLKTSKNVLVNITAGKNKNGLLMKDLNKINELINNYTGNANNFKRGIIWDEDPEVGDKISITVIATGFKMSKLSDITDVNIGNLIIIGNDFEYHGHSSAEGIEIELPEMEHIKIGYNTVSNVRKFNFSTREKPAMCISHGEDFSRIENIPAIRRNVGHSRQEEN